MGCKKNFLRIYKKFNKNAIFPNYFSVCHTVYGPLFFSKQYWLDYCRYSCPSVFPSIRLLSTLESFSLCGCCYFHIMIFYLLLRLQYPVQLQFFSLRYFFNFSTFSSCLFPFFLSYILIAFVIHFYAIINFFSLKKDHIVAREGLKSKI